MLHGKHRFVYLVDFGFRTLKEGRNVVLPCEGVDSGFKILVHLDDLSEDKRALDFVKLSLDAVVHEHDFVKGPHMLAVVVGFSVDLQ